ncbi:MAG: hypothetical protein APF84_02095 [Gracilibacter sp. BRH_c7a]|nr:MAG: hypothetical protein APF84_02095 [Gracilibacter sp. BRH_c7a]
MLNNEIAPHEAFEIHELLQLKNNCALKASNLSGMVADPKLRLILETDLDKTQNQIKDLRGLLQQSEYEIQI